MRRRGRISNFGAGLLAILLIALGSYVAFGGRGPFGGGYEIKAVVRGAPEIRSRTPVRVAGVDAGKVKRMEAGPGRFATLTLTLEDSALPLHRDATLKIRPRTFLEGGFFVDVTPGTPGTPLMEEGDTIPVSSTATPVLLGHATADLRAATRENLSRLISSLRQALDGGGAEALHDAQRHVGPALRSVAQLAEAGRGQREGDLSGAVRATARATDAIASKDERLADLLTGFNRTVRALGARREQLGRSIEELDGLLAEARPALAELNVFFPSARAFAADARPGVRALPRTLRLALPFLDQANALLRPRELPALLRQADPAIRSLARLERPLADLLALVTPVTECLRRNVVPTLKTPVEDPPHSTGDPVYRDLLHLLPNVSSVAQDFDGNGPWIRYNAGFGEEGLVTGLPGLGEVAGSSPDPILGSRPDPGFPPRLPPFRPDVRCVSQDPPDLSAETAAPARAGAGVSRSALRRGLRKLERLIEERGR